MIKRFEMHRQFLFSGFANKRSLCILILISNKILDFNNNKYSILSSNIFRDSYFGIAKKDATEGYDDIETI